MKHYAMLMCGLLMAGSLGAVGAQTMPGSTGGAPPYSTPPTLPGGRVPDRTGPVPPGTSTPEANSDAASQGEEVRVSGCLTNVGNGFSITDRSSNKTYQLRGSSKELADYVNNEVSIHGMTMNATGVSGTAEQSGLTSDELRVASIKKIADQCHNQPK
jgi:hypothetical protein